MRERSDEDLVRETREGDDAAFALLYARHQRAVLARCLRVLRDHDEAADAAQNAMFSALRALRSNAAPTHLRGWLLTIAHNEAVSLLRRSRPTEPLEAGNGGAGPGADEGAFERERLRQLVDDLNALPERQRGALLLREASGFSYRHIASVLGTSAGNARQTVHAARRNLHKRRVGREHGWLGFALPGLAAAWLARTLGLEELVANLTGSGKAALLAGALVAGGGAVTQLGEGSGALLGSAAPTALAKPPAAQALAVLPRQLVRAPAAGGARFARATRNSTTSPRATGAPTGASRRPATAPQHAWVRPTPLPADAPVGQPRPSPGGPSAPADASPPPSDTHIHATPTAPTAATAEGPIGGDPSAAIATTARPPPTEESADGPAYRLRRDRPTVALSAGTGQAGHRGPRRHTSAPTRGHPG
jgi:RNA polymerase sigma factor (sigma-70 family)